MVTTMKKEVTPGFNCRIAIFFQTNSKGQKCAYYWSGRLGMGRAIRMKLAEAELLVAQGQADLLPGHPMKAAKVEATQEPEQVVEETPTVSSVETHRAQVQQMKREHKLTQLNQAHVEGRKNTVTKAIEWFQENEVTITFDGTAYVMVRDEQPQEKIEEPNIEDITPEQLAEIAPFAQEYAEHKQMERATFAAESALETVPMEQERQVVRVEKKSDFSMCGTSWFYSHPECYNPVAYSRDRVDVARLSHREVGSRTVCVECGGSVHKAPEQVQQKPDTAYRHSWDGSHYFYYHRQCVEHRIPEEVTFEQMPLASVPQEVQCEYCYGGMHEPIQYQIEIQHQEMKPTPQPRKKGRPSQDKMIRHYTIDREIAEFIDKLPDGERSRFVNSLLKQGVENARRTNP